MKCTGRVGMLSPETLHVMISLGWAFIMAYININ